MNSVIQKMLNKYDIKNISDETNAIKEILQEIVLCGLSRGNFFDVAAFYGGTALRIFYDLDRFSEDLDFALLKPDSDFDLSRYFDYIKKEIAAYGFNMDITEKIKTNGSNITSAFLKGDTKEHILLFFPNENMQNVTSLKDIKVKFEVDINPPAGATYDIKYNLLPSPYELRTYDIASLYAGKIADILCRNWGNRVKGRDLYDYIYFNSIDAGVNMDLLREKLIFAGAVKIEDRFDNQILTSMLYEKFDNIDYKSAIEDVQPFIKDMDSLKLWKAEFFKGITKV